MVFLITIIAKFIDGIKSLNFRIGINSRSLTEEMNMEIDAAIARVTNMPLFINLINVSVTKI